MDSEVAALIRLANLRLQRRVTSHAAKWVIRETGLKHVGLKSKNPSVINKLARSLDKKSLGPHARAADSYMFFLTDQPLESIYEALNSIQDASKLRKSIIEMLTIDAGKAKRTKRKRK